VPPDLGDDIDMPISDFVDYTMQRLTRKAPEVRGASDVLQKGHAARLLALAG
jgi:hypothetical protein